MKRMLLLGVMIIAAWASTAMGVNDVSVESKNVSPSATGVTIGILLTNDVPVRQVTVPLVVRSVSGGAYISSVAMSFGDRLPDGGPLAEIVIRNEYASEDGACKADQPGGFGTNGPADFVSPDAVLFSRGKLFSPALAPGADVSGSMILTVDIGPLDGIFEVDSTCTDPANHVLFVQDISPPVGILPTFTKGIFTVGAGTCDAVPDHFQFIPNTGESYSLIIDSAALNCQLEPCDEIGVFDGDLCIGASVYEGTWPLPLVAWANDTQTPEKDGYGCGNAMTFRVWRSALATEGPLAATLVQGNGTFCDGPFAELWLSCPPPQTCPVAICQDQVVQAGQDCLASASIDGGSFDPEGDPLIIVQVPPGPYPLGVTSVMLHVSNDRGCADSCNATVTVVDNIPPEISCPHVLPIPVPCIDLVPEACLFGVTASDNCDQDVEIQCSRTDNGGTGSAADPLIITDTYVAIDDAGNPDTCWVFFEVIDAVAPEPVCPNDTTVMSQGADCGALVEFAASATDSCGDVIIQYIPASGSVFGIGVTTVTCIATDEVGNADTCEFDLTVEDAEPPIIICPQDMEVATDSGRCDAIVRFAPEVIENCGGGCVDVVFVIDGSGSMGDDQASIAANAGLFFDSLGNVDFRLGVLAYTNIANPVSTSGLFKPGGAGSGEFTTDQQTFATMVTAVGDTGSGTENGLNALRSALDWYPFRADCRKVLILVTDEDADDLSEFDIIVPLLLASDATIHTVFSYGDSAGYSTLAPTTGGEQVDITDSWGTTLALLARQIFSNVVCVPPSGSPFPVGTTEVKCKVVDGSGNADSCSFDITVRDIVPPKVTCHGDTTVLANAHENGAVVEHVSSAMDNCSIASFNCNPQSGSLFACGSTIVTCIAVDASGNADTCAFTVFVECVPDSCEICGNVTDAAGAPLPDVVVQFWDDWPIGSVVGVDTTSADGQFCPRGLPEGDYELRITLPGYCPQITTRIPCGTQDVSVSLEMLPEVPTQPHAADWWSSASTVEGVPLMSGDVVTAMDPDGVICGVTSVTDPGAYLIHVVSDDPLTGTDEGAEPGDEITLYLNCECPLMAAGAWQPSGSIEFDAGFDCGRIEIPVCDSWTLISFNVMPSSSVLEDVLISIDGSYQHVLSATCEDGNLSWEKDRPINDLTTMDPFHGYWIKPIGSDVGPIVIEGSPVGAGEPLDLCGGWNAISYLPVVPDAINHALSSINGSYEHVFAAECDGIRSWDRNRPAILNDLICMKPGYGYWMKMDHAVLLTYPTSAYACPDVPSLLKPVNLTERITITPLFADFWSGPSGDLSGIRAGDRLTVRSESGVLCGECVVGSDGMFLIHVYGDDPTTELLEGATEGEELLFEANGTEVMLTSGPVRWNDRRSTEVRIESASADAIPERFALLQNYPNPFNAGTIIAFDLAEGSDVGLTVFNVLGQPVRSVFAGFLPAGHHSIAWDGRSQNGSVLQSGIYFYRIETEKWSQSRKMTLLK